MKILLRNIKLKSLKFLKSEDGGYRPTKPQDGHKSELNRTNLS